MQRWMLLRRPRLKIGNSGSRGWILLQRWDSPALPLVITAVIYFILIFVTVRNQDYDFSYFVFASGRWCKAGEVPKGLTVRPPGTGYDGQFYYRLALDPFTSKVTDFGITLDNPAYRHQRILYPLIVWGLSFGCIDCVPVLMVVVNFVCLCVLGWLGGVFARSMRLHSLWGLAFPFYPGFLLSLLRDLTDILCASLLLASLILVRRHKHLPATLLFILATLTRETVLLVAVGAVCVWLNGIRSQKSSDDSPGYFFLSAFLAYLIWQFVLLQSWGYERWNEAHLGVISPSLSWPFSAFFRRLLSTGALHTRLQRLQFVEMLLIVAFGVVVAWSMRSSKASRLEKTSWFVYAALACLLTDKFWHDDWGFLRALSEFYVFGLIILLGSPSKTKIPILACWGAVWLSYFWALTDMTHRILHRLTHLLGSSSSGLFP